MSRTRSVLRRLRGVARAHGWALAVHGTMRRDLDLIGAPWTDAASAPDDLMSAFVAATGYAPMMGRGGAVSLRPHGRRSYLLKDPRAVVVSQKDGKTGWRPKVLDISLMPLVRQETTSHP